MITSTNIAPLNSNILAQRQNAKTAEQSSDKKAIQDDFSWKYGTPWENSSDEELMKINTVMNNAFKVLVDKYNEATKDISSVENSIEQQLSKGIIDENELNEFISKNDLPLVNAFIDKDLMQIYKTSTSLDEFKTKWLELKNQQINKLLKMFLEAGFESDFSNVSSLSVKLDIKA
ncbi:hypothetical protein [Campylobacter troglodytis]|uniref:hypothetical protein n=1 Tax=Campylobacter troglodytis TaxID=654363 RepID=UPI001156E61D|nr:hypothetical protein [Campylobacter troglodytis]TQR53014.1 hypothetical protein DMC01_12340 [Campylobacter troglodytis]